MAAKKQKAAEDGADYRFELNGEVLEVNMKSLTFGEIEWLEMYFDRGLDEIPFGSGRGMLSLAFIAKKRQDPGTTLDDLREIEISSLKEAPKERPTKPQPENSGDQS